MNQITITIPIPPRDCNPNQKHKHWRVLRKATAQARADAHACAAAALNSDRPEWEAAIVHVRWFGRDRRCLKLDTTNAEASLKASLDGLTDAGLWKDDRRVRVADLTIDVDRENPRVELSCEAVP